MTWIVGIDEAGYGPTLGPLVIGASLWQVTGHDSQAAFRNWAEGFEHPQYGRLCVNDSKQLYSPGGGLLTIEASLFAALATIPVEASSFRDLFEWLTEQAWAADEPWHEGWSPSLTLHLETMPISAKDAAVCSAWGDGSAKLVGVGARVVQPQEFNELCDQCGNKATVLTELSLKLAGRMLARAGAVERVDVYCDKHGGRNHYAAALQHFWPEARLHIVQEKREQSQYRLMHREGLFGGGERGGEPDESRWYFTAKGDGFVPTGLASMIAKYLRERCMGAFNDFWLKSLPKLRPTAGYPMDAQRFLAEIESVRQRLAIPERVIKRCR